MTLYLERQLHNFNTTTLQFYAYQLYVCILECEYFNHSNEDDTINVRVFMFCCTVHLSIILVVNQLNAQNIVL